MLLLCKNIKCNKKLDFLLTPNKNICKNNSPNQAIDLLIYVHTSPEYTKRRILIRETWAQRSLFSDVRIIFSMGTSRDAQTNELLRLENSLYGDILQTNFVDSYYNLTYKCIASLEWINTNCQYVKHFLKSDDDVLVNTFAILDFVKTTNPFHTFTCHGWKSSLVMRDLDSKWFLSFFYFALSYFNFKIQRFIPNDTLKVKRYGKYCTGFAVIFDFSLLKSLYNATFDTEFFWVDDYYFTGKFT